MSSSERIRKLLTKVQKDKETSIGSLSTTVSTIGSQKAAVDDEIRALEKTLALKKLLTNKLEADVTAVRTIRDTEKDALNGIKGNIAYWEKTTGKVFSQYHDTEEALPSLGIDFN